jgi:colicin import membrane protein
MSRRLKELQELRRLRERRAEAQLAQARAELETSRQAAAAARAAADQTAERTAAEARSLTEKIIGRPVAGVSIASLRAQLDAHRIERHRSEEAHAAAELALVRQADALAKAKAEVKARQKARSRLDVLADTLSQRRRRADEQKAEAETDEQSLLGSDATDLTTSRDGARG